jgi:hypothetical protein
MGLAGLVSMSLGFFVDLNTYDKSIVAIAIWMVGVPTYLIISGLAKVTPQSIAQFINENNSQVHEDLQILLRENSELDEQTRDKKNELIKLFQETPLYKFLPDKPIRQAYILMLISMLGSFAIWFIS